MPKRAVKVSRSPVSRMDGFVNAVTGLGGVKDKRTYGQHVANAILDQETLQGLYDNSDIAALICDIVPEQALREGFTLSIEEDTERKTKVMMRCDELGLTDKVQEAAVWGNVYGAGAVLMGVDDGQPMDKPIRVDERGMPLKVRKLLYLNVLERRDLVVHRKYTDPLKPKYGEPSHYRLVPLYPGRGLPSIGTVVHESRLVFFWGARTGRRTRLRNTDWPLSRLQRVYEVLRDFEASWGGASLLLQDASQAVYGVKGLLDILLAPDGIAKMQKRMQMIDMSRSTAKAMIIDAEEESFERKPTPFTGISDLLDRGQQRLSAAARIPVTLLMGRSPAGMNATGDADVRGFYDGVGQWRRTRLKPNMEKIVKVILCEDGQAEPETWSLDFPSLYQPTDLEKADVRNKIAAVDKIYLDAGVVTPEEVGMSRFSAEGYSIETTIDLDLRKEMDKLNEEKLMKQAEAELENAGKTPAELAADAGGVVGPDGKPVAPAGGKPGLPKRPSARAAAPGKPEPAKDQ